MRPPSSRAGFAAALAMVLPFAFAGACSGEGEGGPPASSGGAGGSGGAGSSASASEGAGLGPIGSGGASGCEEDCEGVCVGATCCPGERVCGGSCCDEGQACSFQACVAPGPECVDAGDCAEGAYCEYALGEEGEGTGGGGGTGGACQGGKAPRKGRCLPKPPDCPPGEEPKEGEPITCLAACEYKPPVGQFSPVLKYAWGDPAAPNTQDSVMMTPIVVQLDDDDCDGKVDERDLPDIVFSTFTSGNYNDNGTLHAASIVGGALVEKWSVNAGATSPIQPGREIAGGDLDGEPGSEIVTCTSDGRVRAYKGDGSELWISEEALGCSMPSLADFDQDGSPEVLVEGGILDGKTGLKKVAFSPANGQNSVAYDMDGDGKLDVVTPRRVYKADGTLLAEGPTTGTRAAIGDLDRDGNPEVVVVDTPNHELVVWHLDPADSTKAVILRSGVDINGDLDVAAVCPNKPNPSGGGPPTVADFDGDGFPDVALAGRVGYAVFSGKKLTQPDVAAGGTMLWIKQTKDCSSAVTGSSVFDFDGDGVAEVVYADEHALHVYAGPDGKDLVEICNTSGTLAEYPLVADVDGDGQADLVVASNSYSGLTCKDGSKTAGVRVFGDANGQWVRTRRIWNQHAYHVTNVEEDGSIPAVEKPNHTEPKLNNFRQNVQPEGEFSAPDLVASVSALCGGDYAVRATVRNVGRAAAPAGLEVRFYAGDPASGGAELPGSPLATTRVLYPAEAEDVVLPLPSPPADVKSGKAKLFAVVAVPASVHECRENNNASAPADGSCDLAPK